MMYKKKRSVCKLSEQQLLDCSEDYGNRGCYGGLAMNAFRYIKGVGGSCLDCDYPYLAYMWQCADLFCTKAVTCSEAVAVESGSEADLLDALYNVGPIR
jgi:cathepsin L